MNKSFLKFVADFGPLLIFFVIYYKSGNNLAVAIPPLIISTIIAVIAIYLLEKKIPYKMNVIMNTFFALRFTVELQIIFRGFCNDSNAFLF